MNDEVQQELTKHKRHADKLLTIFGSIFTGLFTVLVAAIFNLYQQEHRRFEELHNQYEKRVNEMRPMRQQLNQIAVRMESIPIIQADMRRLIDNNLLTRESLIKLANQINQNRDQIIKLNALVKELDDFEIAELKKRIQEITQQKEQLKYRKEKLKESHGQE